MSTVSETRPRPNTLLIYTHVHVVATPPHLRGIFDGGESVCDDQHSAALHGPVDGLLHQVLTLSIQGTRCLQSQGISRTSIGSVHKH